MTPEHEHDQRLSPQGLRRRDEIRESISKRLPAIAARRKARRRAFRGSLAAALLLTAGAAVVMVGRSPSAPITAPTPPIVEAPLPVEPQRSAIDYAVVQSTPVDPSVYLETDTEAINAMVISDDELLRELASIGRPAGLVRMNGGVRLTRDVADPVDLSEDPG